MWFLKKASPRRSQVRKNIAAERFLKIKQFINADIINSVLLGMLFTILFTVVLSFEAIYQKQYSQIISIAVTVSLISLAACFYIHHYQRRVISNRVRVLALVGLFTLLLTAIKFGMLLLTQPPQIGAIGAATGVAAAIILSIAYDQRFAIGMSIFYCIFACLAIGPGANMNLFLTMTAGVMTCCFLLKEIRTRMKLLKVSAMATVIVFITATALGFFEAKYKVAHIFSSAALHAVVTFLVGLLIQSLLPLIEKTFRIATSMTLIDYSDASQPLLRRLAIEAPGTFSHSLLMGSIAETAAEAIGRNGLLCRVGAYYHDIGKINKPTYFIENEMGSSRHKELSPAMSQLIIVGHVKDGIEMAREYGLPMVLRQFIETHHGTTLIEYFYNEAKKLKTKNSKPKSVNPLSESEFRYPGPKPRTKEAAIVMLADAVESAVRAPAELTPTKIETIVRNMAMKRLQDGQFDECDLSLRELSQIETSISKTLAAHYHGRIAYPEPLDAPEETQSQPKPDEQKNN